MRLRRPKEGQGYASFGRIIAQGKDKDVRINQGYCEGHHHKDIPTAATSSNNNKKIFYMLQIN